MQEEFEVRSSSEGTLRVTPEMDAILSALGCQGFGTRYLGVLKVVVEKIGGRITKQKIVWAEENDPKFNETHAKNAQALLEATVKAVEGGGDPSEMSIKFVVKK